MCVCVCVCVCVSHLVIIYISIYAYNPTNSTQHMMSNATGPVVDHVQVHTMHYCQQLQAEVRE